MSIFGVKRKHVDTSALKQEIFNMRGQALSQINNLNDRYTELRNTVHERHVDTSALKQEISNIKSQTSSQINDLSIEYSGLQNTVREMNINHRLLYNKVENIPDKNIISIFAESKGILQKNEVFSFGNGGKEEGVGYIMNFPGQILGIGLSSKRLLGDVSVVVSINENHQTGYGITLGSASRGYYNFDKPLKVEEGDSINFVCKNNNNTCINTVASLVIELFI